MARSARALLAALLLLASATGTVGQVAAAPADDALRSDTTWEPVQELAPSAGSAELAVDGRGTTTLVWSTTTYPTMVVARQRLADGSWTPETVLGPGAEPEVVADRRGTVTVVWFSWDEVSDEAVVLASRRTPSAIWSPPERLTPPATEEPTRTSGFSQLDVAAGRRGDVVAAWVSGRPRRVQSAFRPRDGGWRTAVDVSSSPRVSGPAVGLTARGVATVVYGVQRRGEPPVIISQVRNRNGRWRPPVRVAEGYNHLLAVARDGSSVVVFTRDFSTLLASTRRGGDWGKPQRLLRGGALDSVAVDVDASGRFVVAAAHGKARVDVVVRRDGRPWSSPRQLLTGSSSTSYVMVAVNDAGDTFVGWGIYGVFGRFRPHAGSWGPLQTAWPDAGVDVLESSDAAMAPDGDVSVVWDQEEAPLRARVLITDP